MKREDNGFLALAIGLIIVFLGFGMYEFSKLENTFPRVSSPNVQNTATPPVSAAQTASWKTYTDSQFGISLKYPSDFTLTEEPGQSVTLVAPVKNYFRTKLTGEAGLTITNPTSACPVSDGDKNSATTSSQISSPAGTFQNISFSGVGAVHL